MPTETLAEIDEVLIRYADTLSPEAISFKIAGKLTPAQVASRISLLLQTPDRLTQLQQDQLVTLKMRQLVARFEEMPLNARNGEMILRGLEAIGTRIDKRQESTQQELHQLYAFQGTVMLDAALAMFNHVRELLPPDTIPDSMLETGLRYAQLEIAKHESDAE